MQGYIKDYRKEIDSDVWLMPPLYHRIWQWLKYNVNHDDATIPMRDGSTLQIKRGQRLTSIRDLAKSVGWYEGVKWKEPNPKTVSVILEWMESKSMITIDRGHGNRQYTLLTLINWDIYNPKPNQGNSSETVSKHLVDINNNDLNDFNDLNTSYSTTTDDFEVIRVRFRELHAVMDLPYNDHPLLSSLLTEGIPKETIIGVMESKFKASARTIGYYEAAIREAHERIINPVAVGGEGYARTWRRTRGPTEEDRQAAERDQNIPGIIRPDFSKLSEV